MYFCMFITVYCIVKVWIVIEWLCFAVIGEFVLIPMHTSPSNATKEIDELYDVFVDIRKRWKIEVRYRKNT